MDRASGMKAAQVLLTLLLVASAASGCSVLPDGSAWGESATARPGLARVRATARDALLDPWTWGPVLAATAFQIDGWDRRVSDWARRETPIFGSTVDAENWSDDLRSAAALAHYVTIIATPGSDEPERWLVSKTKGALVQAAAVSGTGMLTRAMKTGFDRERPTGEDTESFPSGHTSSAAAHARLASRNLRWIDLGRGPTRALDVGLVALTVGTSWARIEAGAHFPSDTLVGAALGNFVASFINDAFLGRTGSTARVGVNASSEGLVVSWRVAF